MIYVACENYHVEVDKDKICIEQLINRVQSQKKIRFKQIRVERHV